jgi:hypothetical protein
LKKGRRVKRERQQSTYKVCSGPSLAAVPGPKAAQSTGVGWVIRGDAMGEREGNDPKKESMWAAAKSFVFASVPSARAPWFGNQTRPDKCLAMWLVWMSGVRPDRKRKSRCALTEGARGTVAVWTQCDRDFVFSTTNLTTYARRLVSRFNCPHLPESL